MSSKQDMIRKEILIAIKSRNEMYQKHIQHLKDHKIVTDYIKKRKWVVDMIQKSKEEYYYEAFEDCKNKASKIWSLTNNLFRNKVKENVLPVNSFRGTDIITVGKDICECFNDNANISQT